MHSCFQPRSTSVSSVLLHDSTGCAPKDYFGHEHHVFRERLLLLLHPLASGVLLVLLLFSTAVHKRTQRALARLYGLRSKRLLRPRASPVPGATTTASTFPRQWRLAGRLDLPPRPALLLVLHSCFRLRWVPSTLLHIDSQFCAPKEITSGTSITRSMSDCYCFYVLSPTASCWQTGLSLAPLHLIVVPSFCCRLWRKRNIPARSFTRIFLALPHEQPSSARSSCRMLYTTSFLMNS
ncbi:uncharacterized protein LOC142564158 [Dermacentor variabilis]|uniref:uncharacterized protein LOC142564158 n=1 Tax=Dermacentor variabilis TaxID=34621 RepID=UPI003F5AE1AC